MREAIGIPNVSKCVLGQLTVLEVAGSVLRQALGQTGDFYRDVGVDVTRVNSEKICACHLLDRKASYL